MRQHPSFETTNNREFEFDLGEDLFLGKFPQELSRFAKIVISKQAKNEQIKECARIILWGRKWFDITMLSYLSSLIVLAKDVFKNIELRMPDIAIKEHIDSPEEKIWKKKKIEFLWKIGFWELIRSNMVRSNISCYPNPWSYKPKDTSILINYTKIINENRNNADDATSAWQNQINGTACYPLINKTDTFISQDYLVILVSELIQNTKEHSNANEVSLAGQIFLSGKDIYNYYSKMSRSVPKSIQKLSQQHYVETENSLLLKRKEWLKQHKDSSFLLISCLDTGKGIVKSLKERNLFEGQNDSKRLENAFNADVSTKGDLYVEDSSVAPFDVHGLSQIKRLVNRYDGYLYVCCNSAYMEYCNDKCQSIDFDDIKVFGTIYQILLPLNHSSFNEQETLSISLGEGFREPSYVCSPTPLGLYDFIKEKGGIQILETPRRWKEFVYDLREKVKREYKNRILYLDFFLMPCNRQFISYVLRALRTINWGDQSIVVINASKQLLSIIDYIQRIDNDTYVNNIDKHIEQLDGYLTQAITRNKKGFEPIPLVLPFVSSSLDDKRYILKWMGLSSLNANKRKILNELFNYMLSNDEELSDNDILEILNNNQLIEENRKEEILSWINTTFYLNSGLFTIRKKKCRLNITQRDIADISFNSLYTEFEEKMVSKMVWPNGNGYLFRMGWREDNENRYRKKYYFAWDVMSNAENREKCTELLMRKAYCSDENIFQNIDAVVSATASAGLLGREIAKRCNCKFAEVPSIYEIKKKEWFAGEYNKRIIIVDDVIDSGTLTKKLLDNINPKHKVVAVLALLQNKNEKMNLNENLKIIPIVLKEDDFGQPSLKEINYSENKHQCYIIDPYSLEPVDPDNYRKKINETKMNIDFKERIQNLCLFNALKVGHFEYNRHHYSMYFSLPNAIENELILKSIVEWVVNGILKDMSGNSILIVYPYYSHIGLLILEIDKQLKDRLKDKPLHKVLFYVARPASLPGGRTAYKLPKQILENIKEIIFIDDSVASGGTLSSIIDELLKNENEINLHALILFERIDPLYPGNLKVSTKYYSKIGTKIKGKRSGRFCQIA